MSQEPFIPLVGGGGQRPSGRGREGLRGQRDVGVSLCMQQPRLVAPSLYSYVV